MDDVPQGKQTVSDDEIVRRLREHPDPAFTTSEIGDMFEMSTEGIRGRLADLEDRGLLCRKKPTSRTVVWWVPEDQRASACSA